MFKSVLKCLFGVLLFLQVTALYAGGDDPIYTDFKPVYKQFRSFYIIDKIEYTDVHTIIYFRYVSNVMGNAIYYSRNGVSPWFLKNKGAGPRAFELIEIRNIRMNGKVVCSLLKKQPEISFMTFPGDVFTCQVVFDRLPNTVTKVDLIEGRGQEQSTEHFNGFDLQIKPMDSDDLGDESDLRANVKKFEKKNRVKVPEKDLPAAKKKHATPADEDPDVKEDIVVFSRINEDSIRLAKQKEEELKELERRRKVIVFTFEKDTTEFSSYDMASQYLSYIANYLYEHKEYVIELHGYTDNILDEDKAMALSKKRGDYVRVALEYRGVKPDRITVVPHGKKGLWVEDRISGLNRRVEVVFIKKN